MPTAYHHHNANAILPLFSPFNRRTFKENSEAVRKSIPSTDTTAAKILKIHKYKKEKERKKKLGRNRQQSVARVRFSYCGFYDCTDADRDEEDHREEEEKKMNE